MICRLCIENCLHLIKSMLCSFFISYSAAHLRCFPVAAQSKVWVCSSSLVVIASSNPAEGMDVCHL